jgi:hypothetical protein
MFDDENDARVRFCVMHDSLIDPCMSLEEKKITRKKLSKEYYKKD